MKYKEFLNMKNGYTLEILPEHAGDDKESGLIEAPAGAEVLKSTLHGDIFYKKNIDGLQLPFSFAYVEDESWVGTSTNPHDEKDTFFKCTLWQRHTQAEELPFIDDEPQSLNDQYAEIEQVRQHGLKLDNGKPRHSLLPKGSISSIIAVLEFGAKKYEANNWQKVDNAKERYYDAAMRHIDSWWNGEKFDQETGIHHLAHAVTNLSFLKWFDDKENNNG